MKTIAVVFSTRSVCRVLLVIYWAQHAFYEKLMCDKDTQPVCWSCCIRALCSKCNVVNWIAKKESWNIPMQIMHSFIFFSATFFSSFPSSWLASCEPRRVLKLKISFSYTPQAIINTRNDRSTTTGIFFKGFARLPSAALGLGCLNKHENGQNKNVIVFLQVGPAANTYNGEVWEETWNLNFSIIVPLKFNFCVRWPIHHWIISIVSILICLQVSNLWFHWPCQLDRNLI